MTHDPYSLLIQVGNEERLMQPKDLTLKGIIDRLEQVANQDAVLKVGFVNPHSYRGDYSELAFQAANDIPVKNLLAYARSALGSTYEGWKGGEFTMRDYTTCYLVSEEGMCGEMIGAVFLELMLNNVKE